MIFEGVKSQLDINSLSSWIQNYYETGAHVVGLGNGLQ